MYKSIPFLFRAINSRCGLQAGRTIQGTKKHVFREVGNSLVTREKKKPIADICKKDVEGYILMWS